MGAKELHVPTPISKAPETTGTSKVDPPLDLFATKIPNWAKGALCGIPKA